MADELGIGVFEQLVTVEVAKALAAIDEELLRTARLEGADAPDRIALHLGRQIRRAMASVPESLRAGAAVTIVQAVLDSLRDVVANAGVDGEELVDPTKVLLAIGDRSPDGSPRISRSPGISLLDTTLLTNAPKEPRIGSQVSTEIESAHSIDVVMAFVRLSGINPLTGALRRHCETGGRLRLITTTYTGSTQRAALDVLEKLGAEIRISYDTSTTRLHAKAWIFGRPRGFSTAYIGSSNLTHSAQVAGLEWNVRVSGVRNPDVINKMQGVFDSYWESPDFVPYDAEEFERQTAGSERPTNTIVISPIGVTPRPFQDRLLEELAIERSMGHHRNLLVAATGTGKTVMAALDYARLAEQLPRARLLFVAHRKEILDQSQATFCQVLRDASFGEQWVGGTRPKHFEHVFASIQSLNKVDLQNLDPQHFDVVIVDEFHHAEASTYERILNHLDPVELLGLTATPERADGQDILHWFGGRIAAELRLWSAIEQQYLAPFAYYGISDGLSLEEIPWKRGVGYDVGALTNLYTSNHVWAQKVVKEFIAHIDNPNEVRALGFCVSVEHARFMAEEFRRHGVNAVAISGDSLRDEREKALRDLGQGNIRVIFSVDLFNEGVDVPAVDAVLMLRPTDSATLFLQQLGRGLRKAPGKSHCAVLDFVGQHRKEFRFDRRFRALLGGTSKDLEQQVQEGFPFLPAGCHMELDRIATEAVLRSIKQALPTTKREQVQQLKAMCANGVAPTLTHFLVQTGLGLEDVYAQNRSWSELLEAAGQPLFPPGPVEVTLRRAIGRLLHVNDPVRMTAWALITSSESLTHAGLRTKRAAAGLLAQLMDMVPSEFLGKGSTLEDAVEFLELHPQVMDELRQLAPCLESRVDHVYRPLSERPESPLMVHARYTRQEILSAFSGAETVRNVEWREGVKWVEPEKADLFTITLDKSGGNFSATTRYHDYAISPILIHWESQSSTRGDSPTGRRYQEHVARGSDVYLFCRLRPDDRAFWFLGPATYVNHEGDRPMAVTWRLAAPLPGDLFADFAVAVA